MTASKPYISAMLCMVLALVTTACNKAYNPLDDYEEVKPTTGMAVPEVATGGELVERGKYLVELLGCANCHTDGALIGEADPAKRLAGSSIGIAYSNPLENSYPGIVFPANLTPDEETGIGAWTDIQLITMIRSGVDRHGRSKLSVMPWPAYSIVSDDDALAIASYLRQLPPVRHRVPASIKPGQKSDARYVHFGMYRSRE